MPLYDFACPRCGARFEARTGVDAPGPACPECARTGTERILTGFATSRSPGLRGAPAQRSNAERRIREEARAERKADREARRANPFG